MIIKVLKCSFEFLAIIYPLPEKSGTFSILWCDEHIKNICNASFALDDLASVLDTMNILKFIEVQNTHFNASVAEMIFLLSGVCNNLLSFWAKQVHWFLKQLDNSWHLIS